MARIVSVCGIAAFLGFMCLLIGASFKARAHSDGNMTYPHDCCANNDCAPVIRSENLKYNLFKAIDPNSPDVPVMLVETKHGSAMVPPNLKPRDSKDHRMHACIRNGAVVCIFYPPSI
jgi:hypothetical protein